MEEGDETDAEREEDKGEKPIKAVPAARGRAPPEAVEHVGDHVIEQLEQYWSDELSVGEAEQIEEHLDACEECQAALDMIVEANPKEVSEGFEHDLRKAHTLVEQEREGQEASEQEQEQPSREPGAETPDESDVTDQPEEQTTHRDRAKQTKGSGFKREK